MIKDRIKLEKPLDYSKVGPTIEELAIFRLKRFVWNEM